MSGHSPDVVFQRLVAAFPPGSDEGLVDIRRSGDEAVLMFRWRPHRDLFGVPVSLTRTDRRIDWDQPASDLEDWLDSVDLWLMEDVENGFLYRGRRRMVDDYIELRGPNWPVDERFFVDVVAPRDQESWLRVPFMAGDGLHPELAVERREGGTLLAWITAYENNSTGSPYVGQATVVRETSALARLDFVEFVDGVPSTVVLDVVRAAMHAAAEAGATTVVTQLDVEHLHIAGFRSTADGQLAVDTRFLDEDPQAADVLLRDALAAPGPWGRDRDRAGRYLPRTRLARVLHRLRYGSSGTKPLRYIG